MMLGGGKDGVAGDFRAGASGGRNGDERGRGSVDSFAAANHFEIIEQLAVVGEHGGDRFSGIQCAATVESDYHIAPLIARLLDTLLDGFDFGLAENRKGQTSNTVVAQRS